jgi:hypothetical protein
MRIVVSVWLALFVASGTGLVRLLPRLWSSHSVTQEPEGALAADATHG